MFEGQDWYEYLDEPMRDLVDEAYYLLDREQMRGSGLHDYSFVVFPIAKAYEGFLKKYFFELGLISEEDFRGSSFRIGRGLNPSLPTRLKDKQWIFDDVRATCNHKKGHGGKNLADVLWNGWTMGRNRVFHYFVGHEEFLSLQDAQERIEMMRSAMEETLVCKKSGKNREG